MLSFISTSAFVPSIVIPIHAISSLFNLIFCIIEFASIFPLNTPVLKPSSSSAIKISSFGIFSFPEISIFQTKLDIVATSTTAKTNIATKIFLFLYLFNMKGNPHFFLILIFVPVFFAIVLICL